jgi:hypothetical protein
MKKWLLTALVVVIYLLHQDCWNWQKIGPLVFGFLPIGLAYHGAFSLAAAGLMWLLVKYAWPTDLDRQETTTNKSNPPEA